MGNYKERADKVSRIIQLEKEIEKTIKKSKLKYKNVKEAEQDIKDTTAQIATWKKQIEEAELRLPKVKSFYDKKSKDLEEFLEENDLFIDSNGKIKIKD